MNQGFVGDIQHHLVCLRVVAGNQQVGVGQGLDYSFHVAGLAALGQDLVKRGPPPGVEGALAGLDQAQKDAPGHLLLLGRQVVHNGVGPVSQVAFDPPHLLIGFQRQQVAVAPLE